MQTHAIIFGVCAAVIGVGFYLNSSRGQDPLCAVAKDGATHNRIIVEAASELDLTKFRCDGFVRSDASHVVVKWSFAIKPGTTYAALFGPVFDGESHLKKSLDGVWFDYSD
jgi:hypothetical protein